MRIASLSLLALVSLSACRDPHEPVLPVDGSDTTTKVEPER